MSRRRLVVVVVAVLACFGVLVGKLAQLQAVSPDRYRAQAKSQRFHEETLRAPRGAILDRNGEPLATSVERRSIWADPALVTDPLGAARALAGPLGRPVEELQRQLTNESRFEYLSRSVDDRVADAVEALALPGVATLPEPARYQPSGDLAQGIIGYTDTDGVGIAGVEKQFDAVLTGTDGSLVQERARDGHTIPAGEHSIEPAKPGRGVVLTLDRELQYVAEQAVAERVHELRAKWGLALVMNPKTGEILASASVVGAGDGKPVRNSAQNYAFATTYEPGSVMKLVTLAGVIEAGIARAGDYQHVPTSIQVADALYRDDTRAATEDLTVRQIFSKSSNVGTIGLAVKLGKTKLLQTLDRFGFGKSTDIGFDQEEWGELPPVDRWDTDLSSMAIGQALTATPLQVLLAYNAAANGGEYVPPSLVRATVDADGAEHREPSKQATRVVSEDTAAQLRSMAASVVAEGTGAQARVEGYDVAGKTGTAWKASSGTYGNDGARAYSATFVGFAPAENPKLSMIVVIDEPAGAEYAGGLAAAPVFARIAKQALIKLDVAPRSDGTDRSPTAVGVRAKASVAPPTTAATVPPLVAAPAPTSGNAAPVGKPQTASPGTTGTAAASGGIGGGRPPGHG